jgi:hypothetical protein
VALGANRLDLHATELHLAVSTPWQESTRTAVEFYQEPLLLRNIQLEALPALQAVMATQIL